MPRQATQRQAEPHRATQGHAPPCQTRQTRDAQEHHTPQAPWASRPVVPPLRCDVLLPCLMLFLCTLRRSRRVFKLPRVVCVLVVRGCRRACRIFARARKAPETQPRTQTRTRVHTHTRPRAVAPLRARQKRGDLGHRCIDIPSRPFGHDQVQYLFLSVWQLICLQLETCLSHHFFLGEMSL